MAEQKEGKKHLFCPYCDTEIMSADFPYCRACGITVLYCPVCRGPVPREEWICPKCGSDIREEAQRQ